MTPFTIMEKAREAMEMIKAGRSILSSVTDAIRDGEVALNTDDQKELNALLADEQRETEAAHNALARAINTAKGV